MWTFGVYFYHCQANFEMQPSDWIFLSVVPVKDKKWMRERPDAWPWGGTVGQFPFSVFLKLL